MILFKAERETDIDTDSLISDFQYIRFGAASLERIVTPVLRLYLIAIFYFKRRRGASHSLVATTAGI